MDRLSYKGKVFTFYEYSKESDFERDVIEHSKEIFGPKSLYIDIKKRIKKDKGIIRGQVLQYNKRDSRIYWPTYTTASRVNKRIEREDEK